MNKFVILFALVAVVVAEPPASVVSYGAPQYAAPTYSYAPAPAYYDHDDGSSYVDDALLARVAQLLEQNDGGYSGGYSAPSSGYGAPAQSSGGILLGRPERAHRVAEFDLTDSHSGGYSSGGYSGGYRR